ncbi:MAG: UvrD-helicase domain-containing protein, partial [Steroidobacteraceae bacterium]
AELLAFFPQAEAHEWSDELRVAVRGALDRIDLTFDTTNGTRDYVAKLRDAGHELGQPSCPWSVWMSLSTAKATRRSDAIAAQVRAAATAYDRHPLFHADVRTYIEGVHALAGRTLAGFQTIKTERGLIDFQDMEQQTLRALDEPAIRARLDDELELLLVDEFQDTSPMQLAIFMKLAELARRGIVVGDVKQAIYGFRGCDPQLVFETLQALERGGSAIDVLDSSWRSRPALVHYTNAVFGQAFAGRIPPEQIDLVPERPERASEPAVLWWQVQGKNAGRARALANGIVELVRSGYRVVDPASGEPRAVRWADIAVLAATNGQVEEIAKALRAAQVPMKMTLTGLLTVPEVCLARACLRRLNDRSDTLATAEIIAMTECAEPETWLADRLRSLARGEDSYAWGTANHPIVRKLEALREETVAQSPVEVVARVLHYLGIRDVVTAWGPNAIKAMQRQRNLDAFLNLAVEYERHCDSQHAAATLTGFLFWLEHPHSPELDLQPVVTTGDAVHVLTYHKAKGLEWPVVVNAHLDFVWRSPLWDVRVAGPPRFDAHRPLAGRAIRFWPAVFCERRSGLPVLDRILASDAGIACAEQSDAENRRLAYVGLTRARDAIVLAVPSGSMNNGAWLHSFKGNYLLPASNTLQLPSGYEIPTAVAALDENTTVAATEAFTPRRLPARIPQVAMRENVRPSAAAPVAQAAVGEVVSLGERIPIRGEDITAIGTALHALIASELVNPGRDDRVEGARTLIEGHGMSAFLDAEAALLAADRFRDWIERRFAPRRVLCEYPVTHVLPDARVVRGWIDALVETDAGWIVIDHKSSPRPRSECREEALTHSGQLAAYRQALVAAGMQTVGGWIHFPVLGMLVEVGCTANSDEERASTDRDVTASISLEQAVVRD